MSVRGSLVLLAVCFSLSNGLHSQDVKRNAWGPTTRGLRASISLQNMRVSSRGPFIVSASVQNVSGTAIDVETISSFRVDNLKDHEKIPLSSEGFWCPVSIQTEAPASTSGLILASRSRIVLKPGVEISVRMDLSKHAWEAALSSIWPAREFSAVIPNGRYKLRLDIEVIDRKTPNRVHSKEVSVIIE
jgi:hypothetical protein